MGGSKKNILTWQIGPVKSTNIIKNKLKTFNNIDTLPVAHTLPKSSSSIVLKADSGASKHFLKADNTSV